MKKKILVFHPGLAPYRVDFFNAISKVFDVSFYSYLLNPKEQNFNQEILKKNCQFDINYLSNGFEICERSVRFNIIGLIRKKRPDIILCSEYSPITCLTVLVVKLFFKNIKVYTISDDSIANCEDRKGVRALLRNKIPKLIDGIILTNDEVANWFKIHVDSKIKTLILPIVHNEKVYQEKLRQSIDKANFNIEKYNLIGKKILLYVGRLVEVKNIGFLISCIDKIEAEDFSLVIVGDGDLKSILENQVKELNLSSKILFIGKQEGEALYNWYVFSNVFILPSVYEPYGAVVNEALIGGCYVLCSTVAGASSLIDSSNGVLFDPANELDLINKLKIAIDSSNILENKIQNLRSNKMLFKFDPMINTLINQL